MTNVNIQADVLGKLIDATDERADQMRQDLDDGWLTEENDRDLLGSYEAAAELASAALKGVPPSQGVAINDVALSLLASAAQERAEKILTDIEEGWLDERRRPLATVYAAAVHLAEKTLRAAGLDGPPEPQIVMQSPGLH